MRTHNNNYKHFILVILLLLGIVFRTSAQQYDSRIKSSVTPDSILIGDHVDFTLHVDIDNGQQLGFPELKNEHLQGIEIIEMPEQDTLSNNNGQLTIRQKYIITSFDSGVHVIPSIPILLLTPPNTTDTIFSAPLILKVATIPIDTATYQMYDIKGPMHYAFNIWDYWLIIVIVLSVLIIGALVFYFIIWRKDKRGIFWLQKPKDPPFVVAINELQKLKGEQLWQKDRTKEYYTRLTDIVRQYLEDVFGIQAMEQTSEEILAALDKLNFDKKDLYEALKQLFAYADLAKFAKYNPMPDENESSYQNAYKFIEGTKPGEENIQNEQKTINTQNDNNTEI